MRHGISTNVTGPYLWGKRPDITIDYLGAFDGPKSVVYPDSSTNKTKYSLWLGGGVYLADGLDGPFSRLKGFSYPGTNPAPVWYNGSFYCNFGTTIFTTPALVAGATWAKYGPAISFRVPHVVNPPPRRRLLGFSIGARPLAGAGVMKGFSDERCAVRALSRSHSHSLPFARM
jgi:hypothetical protein